MIKLNEEELNWGTDILKYIKIDIEQKEHLVDNSYVDFLTGLTKEVYPKIVYLLNNIDKIQSDQKVNAKFIDVLNDINGFYLWSDYDSREEVKEYINDEIFLNYVEKIYKIWNCEDED
ncbi:hypothetical protein [Clostridium tagluense]|uniref:hypothetical protein n=1 Tax=Clostridium tagluense TaxID=360422 RepID=UPI001CF5A229|nr:hypothetical protein [Clostridium tagluense]MCB2297059.1 hypothetical protein [Clostridium tagluense]